MDYLLAWHNLIFLIPLSLGVLLVLGTALSEMGAGEGDLDAGGDAGANAGLAGGGEPSDLLIEALSFFGVGRVPLSVVLMTAALLFGAGGTVANVWLEPRLLDPVRLAPISAAIASGAMIVLTGPVATLVARIFPTTESYRIAKTDLIGRLGTLVLPTTEARGLLQVHDHEGNLHQVSCRSRSGALDKGREVLVVDRLDEEDVYVVEPSPFGGDAAVFRRLEQPDDESGKGDSSCADRRYSSSCSD